MNTLQEAVEIFLDNADAGCVFEYIYEWHKEELQEVLISHHEATFKDLVYYLMFFDDSTCHGFQNHYEHLIKEACDDADCYYPQVFKCCA